MKIEVKNQGTLFDLKKFAKELTEQIQVGLDQTLDSAVEDLKSSLTSIINTEITISNQLPKSTEKLPQSLNMPKSKADIVKEIFGTDVMSSDYLKKNLKSNVMDDKSNLLVMKDGRIKAWQSVNDSFSMAQQEQFFRDRLKDGIIVDEDTGKMYKATPDTIKGVKVECSRDSGQTLNSEKKFEAYKNSTKITRRKNDSPYSRVAVWTIKQADAQYMIKNALSVDAIVERVQSGDYDTAVDLLSRNNAGGIYKTAIDNITNIKAGRIVSPEAKSYQTIQTLIRNLKIRKKIMDKKTTYTLFTDYDRDVEDTEEKFFDAMRTQIYLWQVNNEQVWYDTIVKSVETVLKKYEHKV
jgi:hypothetical protein